jgi:hypothetical protein
VCIVQSDDRVATKSDPFLTVLLASNRAACQLDPECEYFRADDAYRSTIPPHWRKVSSCLCYGHLVVHEHT